MEHKMEASWAAVVHNFIYWVETNWRDTDDAGWQTGFPCLHRAMPQVWQYAEAIGKHKIPTVFASILMSLFYSGFCNQDYLQLVGWQPILIFLIDFFVVVQKNVIPLFCFTNFRQSIREPKQCLGQKMTCSLQSKWKTNTSPVVFFH